MQHDSEAKSRFQLNDDNISSFIVELVDYLERTPATFSDNGSITDEGFDHLYEFIHQRLEPFSNGYINFN